MKLVQLQCPHCGANLEVGDQIEQFICNYCGNAFVVDQEIQKHEVKIDDAKGLGKELEKGRREASDAATSELVEKLGALLNHLKTLEKKNNEFERLKKYLEQGKKSYLIPLYISIGMAAIHGMIFFSTMIKAITGKGSFSGIPGLLISAAIFVGIPYAVSFMNKRNYEKACVDFEEASRDLEEYNRATSGSFDMSIIPPDYTSVNAIEFLYRALRNQRAKTVQEAVNLYEDELHKSRMEELQVANIQASLLSAQANSKNR